MIDFKDPDGTGKDLVDLILDKAGQKGTGKWTTQCALDSGRADPDDYRSRRCPRDFGASKISAKKPATLLDRSKADEARSPATDQSSSSKTFAEALYSSKICSYAQGFAMLAAADKEYKFGLQLPVIAKIWKAGCIIRAVFLDEITRRRSTRIRTLAEPAPRVPSASRTTIAQKQDAWRKTRVDGRHRQRHSPRPPSPASLAYYDSYRRSRGCRRI